MRGIICCEYIESGVYAEMLTICEMVWLDSSLFGYRFMCILYLVYQTSTRSIYIKTNVSVVAFQGVFFRVTDHLSI